MLFYIAAFAKWFTNNDYLAWCETEHRDPKKSFTGNFVVRIRPDLHRDASILAEMKDESLNSLVSEALEKYVENFEGVQVKPEKDRKNF